MDKKWIALGSLCAGIGVGLGAFGAHGLKDRLDEDMLEVYRTGVHYHMVHALAILLAALLMGRYGNHKGYLWAARWFLAGTLLFSGSLYLLSITGIKPLGAITPFGGVAFLTGWGTMAYTAWKQKS